MGDPIQLLISIDVEPDKRQVDRDDPAPWRGFEELLRQVGPIRCRLAECTGRPVHFGWYWRLDPQIEGAYGAAAWPLHTYAPAIAELARADDTFGVHPHAWRWSLEQRTWIADHADQDWVSLCLRSSFDTFERFFGVPCKASRFGDSWINEATLDEVEGLGADYDLTIEAGRPPGPVQGWREFNTGDIPDLRDVSRQPYRRDRNDFRRPDADGRGRLWIVPVSGAPIIEDSAGVARIAVDTREPHRRERRRRPLNNLIVAAARALSIRSPALRPAKAHEMSGRGRKPRPKFRPLNIPFLPPQVFACAFEHALSTSRFRYVHAVVRAGDLSESHMRENFVLNMDFLCSNPLVHRFQVSTPGRLAASWAD